MQILKEIENERELGISDGLIYFEDFSYMYMFLDFDIEKKHSKTGSLIIRQGSKGMKRKSAFVKQKS